MQKYGMITEGKLIKSDTLLDGYKPLIYAEVPEFDQINEYVTQLPPEDKEEHIFLGVQIHQLVQDNEESFDGFEG